MNRCHRVPMSGLCVWASGLFLCLGFCVAAVPPASGGECVGVREWTDDTGRHSVVAELIDFQNDQVRLKTEAGQIVTVPVFRFSDADRRYLALWKQKRPDATPQQPPSGNTVGPQANGADRGRPKTGRCCFQVFGLNHKEMGVVNKHLLQYGPQFGPFVRKQYGFCDECWEVIQAEEGYRASRRYLSGGRTGEYDRRPDRYDHRKVPWDISTYPDFPLDTDLAPIAKAVLTPKTPHRSARVFYALLYATLDADQAKRVRKALAGLPGVDARRSNVDVKAGRIQVRISGQRPIRMTDLVAALEKAGIEVTTSRGR